MDIKPIALWHCGARLIHISSQRLTNSVNMACLFASAENQSNGGRKDCGCESKTSLRPVMRLRETYSTRLKKPCKIKLPPSATLTKCGARCGAGAVRLEKNDFIQRLATECGILSPPLARTKSVKSQGHTGCRLRPSLRSPSASFQFRLPVPPWPRRPPRWSTGPRLP